MEDSTREWINKIESKLESFSLDSTRMLATISTKLDLYLGKQDDHERRLTQLEEHRHKQDGVNESSNKRYTRITVILIASEVLFLGVGILLTFFMKT